MVFWRLFRCALSRVDLALDCRQPLRDIKRDSLDLEQPVAERAFQIERAQYFPRLQI